jgi:hypothetical protein
VVEELGLGVGGARYLGWDFLRLSADLDRSVVVPLDGQTQA